MTKIIKLESIVKKGFDRKTGISLSKVTEEYVCESCRHLVEALDTYCWQCGGKLEQSNQVEYYKIGKKLTVKEFNEEIEAL